MAPPLKILVAADFSPQAPAGPPLRLGDEGVDGLMAALRPGLKLGEPVVDLVFDRLEDFTPAALRQGRPELERSGDALTSVLHHPGFMALESAWRGLAFLARALPAEGVVLEVLNAPAGQLRQRLYDHVLMPQYRGECAEPLGMALLDYDFDHKPASLEVLADLAKMGESLQAPLVAQTTAAFFGVSHLLHLAALQGLDTRLAGPEYTSYNALRQKSEATWLGLCLNRFLLRPPWDMPGYGEPASADHPERYLWGRAVWILGANLARAWARDGHPAGISGSGPMGAQSGLATRDLPVSRSEKITTPLEAVFPQAMVEMLPYFGLSPLTQMPPELSGGQQQDTAYLHLAANLRRFTDPTGRQPGLLTVYTTLAYSLMLGRVANLAMDLAGAAAGQGPEEAAGTVCDGLKASLGPLAEGEVSVEPGEGGLAVRVVPKILIHSKPVELELELPLPG